MIPFSYFPSLRKNLPHEKPPGRASSTNFRALCISQWWSQPAACSINLSNQPQTWTVLEVFPILTCLLSMRLCLCHWHCLGEPHTPFCVAVSFPFHHGIIIRDFIIGYLCICSHPAWRHTRHCLHILQPVPMCEQRVLNNLERGWEVLVTCPFLLLILLPICGTSILYLLPLIIFSEQSA